MKWGFRVNPENINPHLYDNTRNANIDLYKEGAMELEEDGAEIDTSLNLAPEKVSDTFYWQCCGFGINFKLFGSE